MFRFCLYWMCLWCFLLTHNLSAADTAVPNTGGGLCGPGERLMFQRWSEAAGRPGTHLTGRKDIVDIALNTRSGEVLRGYKLRGLDAIDKNSAKGYLLVVQGNAMLADQIIESFQIFASAGYDVYVFDYRGYGRSEGEPGFQGILGDYREIIGYLDSLSYASARFYGMSYGGVVLLNALMYREGAMRAVVDSARGRFSTYGCPETHDPIRNLPERCANFLVLVGLQDRVVRPEASRSLVDQAKRCGASVYIDPDLNHPFMDTAASLHRRRMQRVKSFLLESE